jgi:hypothetical protein
VDDEKKPGQLVPSRLAAADKKLAFKADGRFNRK